MEAPFLFNQEPNNRGQNQKATGTFSGARVKRTGIRGKLDEMQITINNVKRVEGSRGVAERIAIVKRYASYSLLLIIGSAIVGACFKGTSWSSGGMLLLASTAAMVLTAAIGTITFPERRMEVQNKLSEMLWGWCFWPSIGLAILDRVLRGFLSDPAHQDQFTNIISYSLPYVFALTVLLPCFLFIKVIAMIRSENRDNRDMEETMRLWQRQDGDQR